MPWPLCLFRLLHAGFAPILLTFRCSRTNTNGRLVGRRAAAKDLNKVGEQTRIIDLFERMFHGVRMRIGRCVTYVKEHMKKKNTIQVHDGSELCTSIIFHIYAYICVNLQPWAGKL